MEKAKGGARTARRGLESGYDGLERLHVRYFVVDLVHDRLIRNQLGAAHARVSRVSYSLEEQWVKVVLMRGRVDEGHEISALRVPYFVLVTPRLLHYPFRRTSHTCQHHSVVGLVLGAQPSGALLLRGVHRGPHLGGP